MQAGALNFLLARCEHTSYGSMVRALATLLSLKLQLTGATGIDAVSDLIDTMATWDLGYEALFLGVGEFELAERTDQRRIEQLLVADHAGAVDILWRAGVLRHIGQLPEEADNGVTSALQAGFFDEAIDRVERHHELRGFGATGRLALNAVLMVEHYARNRSAETGAFAAFLRRLPLSGWPFDCRANDKFLGVCGISRDDLQSAAQIKGRVPASDWTVAMLTEPLEVLNLGTAFDSCLRFGGPKREILGWASNANIMILALRDEDGRVVGRRTIGLLSDPRRCLVLAPSYPIDNETIAGSIDNLLKRIERALDLKRSLVTNSMPCPTYAISHTDDFV